VLTIREFLSVFLPPHQGAGIVQWYSSGLRAGRLGFRISAGIENYLFTTVSRPALVSTQLPIQWIPGALSLGIKRPVREADHSSPSSAEVKNAWSSTSTHLVRHHGVVLSYKTQG
jgi:hypothetical protein